MGRKSLTRKQIRYYEDPIWRGMRRTVQAVRTYYPWILGGIAITISVLFGWVVWSQRIDQQAGPLLFATIEQARQWLQNPSNDPKTFEDIVRRLERLRREFRNPAITVPATYYLASLYLQTDRPRDARPLFASIRDAPEPFGSLAALGYAQALAGMEDYAAAVREIETLRKRSVRSVADDYLDLLKARWLWAMHRVEDARALLSEFAQKYPDSPFRGDATQLLNEIASATESPS